MSVFTPGDFTDLTGETETEAGWLTSEEHQEPGQEVRERKVGRERDTNHPPIRPRLQPLHVLAGNIRFSSTYHSSE